MTEPPTPPDSDPASGFFADFLGLPETEDAETEDTPTASPTPANKAVSSAPKAKSAIRQTASPAATIRQPAASRKAPATTATATPATAAPDASAPPATAADAAGEGAPAVNGTSDAVRCLAIDAGPRTNRWALVGMGLVASILTTPIRDLRDPTIIENVDPSWQIALHQISQDGVSWGDEVVNTLGPLGFAVFPFLSGGLTGWLSILGYLLLHLLAAVLTITLIARRVPTSGLLGNEWVRLGLAFAATVVVSLAVWTPLFELLLVPEACAAMFALFCLDRLTSIRPAAAEGSIPRERPAGPFDRFAVVLGVIVALLLLVKLSTGLQAVTVAVLTLAALGWLSRDLRAAMTWFATWGASLAVTYLVAWVVLGQSLANVVSHALSAVSMAGAYAANMAVERPELEWSMRAGLAVLLVIVVATLSRASSFGWLDRLIVTAPLFPFLFFAFKLGFVREDFAHVPPFFLSVGVVVLAVVGPNWGSVRSALPSLLLLVAGALAVFAGWQSQPDNLRRPISEVVALGDNVSEVGDRLELLLRGSQRSEAVDSFRAATVAKAGFSPETLAMLNGSRVHVDPWETSLLWVHEEIEWAAPPVFQTYLAFTAHFDDENAAWLRSDETAPDFILRSPRAIDRRHPAHESPEYMIEMLCRYEPVGTQLHGKGRRAVEYTILERVPTRCGDIRELSRTEMPVRSKVPYPAGCTDTEVPLFQVQGLDTFAQRIRSTVYKDAAYTVRFSNRWQRLVQGTAEQWHLTPMPWLPEWITGQPQQVNDFFVGYNDEPSLTADSVEVVFGCLPLQR